MRDDESAASLEYVKRRMFVPVSGAFVQVVSSAIN